jgi:hypothetical protein
MSAIKKGHSETTEQINSRIQRKFDQVFSDDKNSSTDSTGSQSLSMVLDSSTDFGEIEMSSGAQKKEPIESPVIDLDFTIEDELSESAPSIPELKSVESSAPKALSSEDNGLDFSLDFNSVDELMPEKISSADSSQQTNNDSGMDLGLPDATSGGMELENVLESKSDFNEDTQKTIVISLGTNSNVDLKTFSLETSDHQTTADQMTSEEALANIESTIKDIIRPKEMKGGASNPDKTPSNSFSLSDLMEDDNSEQFSVDVTPQSNFSDSSATGEFFLDPLDLEVEEEVHIEAPSKAPKAVSTPAPAPIAKVVEQVATPVVQENSRPVDYGRVEKMTDDDSIRFHATIRQLREEREELLGQIKNLKSEQKELEQDNLSLKAGFDEAKIEISILRKRHMVELEDLKYRLTLSEEKKALSDEKARQSELRREKLEQRVRIDYNQVKLREKELESKLEMLSMDIDSQVHSRDHKILELRRKIDALEFNMENASIKEQRSNEDKRMLEDKLSKIMKTLRNSIKNLEEDIEHVQEDLPETEKN